MSSGYGSIYAIAHLHWIVVNPTVNIFDNTFCCINTWHPVGNIVYDFAPICHSSTLYK